MQVINDIQISNKKFLAEVIEFLKDTKSYKNKELKQILTKLFTETHCVCREHAQNSATGSAGNKCVNPFCARLQKKASNLHLGSNKVIQFYFAKDLKPVTVFRGAQYTGKGYVLASLTHHPIHHFQNRKVYFSFKGNGPFFGPHVAILSLAYQLYRTLPNFEFSFSNISSSSIVKSSFSTLLEQFVINPLRECSGTLLIILEGVDRLKEWAKKTLIRGLRTVTEEEFNQNLLVRVIASTDVKYVSKLSYNNEITLERGKDSLFVKEGCDVKWFDAKDEDHMEFLQAYALDFGSDDSMKRTFMKKSAGNFSNLVFQCLVHNAQAVGGVQAESSSNSAEYMTTSMKDFLTENEKKPILNEVLIALFSLQTSLKRSQYIKISSLITLLLASKRLGLKRKDLKAFFEADINLILGKVDFQFKGIDKKKVVSVRLRGEIVPFVRNLVAAVGTENHLDKKNLRSLILSRLSSMKTELLKDEYRVILQLCDDAETREKLTSMFTSKYSVFRGLLENNKQFDVFQLLDNTLKQYGTSQRETPAFVIREFLRVYRRSSNEPYYPQLLAKLDLDEKDILSTLTASYRARRNLENENEKIRKSWNSLTSSAPNLKHPILFHDKAPLLSNYTGVVSASDKTKIFLISKNEVQMSIPLVCGKEIEFSSLHSFSKLFEANGDDHVLLDFHERANVVVILTNIGLFVRHLSVPGNFVSTPVEGLEKNGSQSRVCRLKRFIVVQSGLSLFFYKFNKKNKNLILSRTFSLSKGNGAIVNLFNVAQDSVALVFENGLCSIAKEEMNRMKFWSYSLREISGADVKLEKILEAKISEESHFVVTDETGCIAIYNIQRPQDGPILSKVLCSAKSKSDLIEADVLHYFGELPSGRSFLASASSYTTEELNLSGAMSVRTAFSVSKRKCEEEVFEGIGSPIMSLASICAEGEGKPTHLVSLSKRGEFCCWALDKMNVVNKVSEIKESPFVVNDVPQEDETDDEEEELDDLGLFVDIVPSEEGGSYEGTQSSTTVSSLGLSGLGKGDFFLGAADSSSESSAGKTSSPSSLARSYVNLSKHSVKRTIVRRHDDDFRFKERIQQVEIGGSHVVVAAQGDIRVFDLESGQLRQVLTTGTGSGSSQSGERVYKVKFSPNSNLLGCVTSSNCVVYRYDPKEDRLREALSQPIDYRQAEEIQITFDKEKSISFSIGVGDDAINVGFLAVEAGLRAVNSSRGSDRDKSQVNQVLPINTNKNFLYEPETFQNPVLPFVVEGELTLSARFSVTNKRAVVSSSQSVYILTLE
eukprot:augustus_masked-scaffold_3-processed-gene-16.13-mRNA-1 protein AED:1.00 eAED:1.00 QI:0/-1/0/0/-1/1/1/0/1277